MLISRSGLCLTDKRKRHCRIWCLAEGWSVGTNDSDKSVAASSRGTMVVCPSAILPTLRAPGHSSVPNYRRENTRPHIDT
jgi:hypothetical protein